MTGGTNGHVGPEVRRALDVAAGMAAAGVPLFIARADLSKPEGFALPKRWEQVTADPAVVDSWRPGDALCAVMGHRVDLLDLDDYNGAALAGLERWPNPYGVAATPSGGRHVFIAPLRVGSKNGVMQGIDVKSGRADGTGRGFAFIAPTVRVGKVDHQPHPYIWLAEPNLSALVAGVEDTSGAELASKIEGTRGYRMSITRPTVEVAVVPAPGVSAIMAPARSFTRDEAWQRFCGRVLAELAAAPDGTRNERLNIAAKTLSHFTDFWPIEQMTEWLLAALPPNPHRRWDPLRTIESAMRSAPGDWRAVLVEGAGFPDRSGVRSDPVPAGAEPEPGRRIMLTAANGIAVKKPRWLYDRRMPAGALTLLSGREGIGKTTISAALVAGVTLGTLPGDHLGQPRGAAILAGEDDWSCVIVPRLAAAGADLSKVFRIEAVTTEGAAGPISLPADLPELAGAVLAHDIALLVCDPLMSIIHGALDTHKDRDVRVALDPLVRFAADRGVAVLGLIHVNKGSDGDPLNRIMGSRAFSAVARSVLHCLTDPDVEDGERPRYLFAHSKSNYGPMMPMIRYHIETAEQPFIDAAGAPDTVQTSRVEWDGEDTARTLREALEAAKPTSARPTGENTQAILKWVTEQGRTVSVADVAEAFPEIKIPTVKKTLSRLCDRGDLLRPAYGHYSARRSNAAWPEHGSALIIGSGDLGETQE